MPTGKIVSPPSSAVSTDSMTLSQQSDNGFFVEVTDAKPENREHHKKGDLVFILNPDKMKTKLNEVIKYELAAPAVVGLGKNPAK
jgi:hypothetical protein